MTHVLRCSGYEVVVTDIVRGQGSSLYDVNGKRYVDLEAGVWCTGLGRNHPRIKQAILAQLEQIMHMGYRYTDGIVEEAAVAVLDTLDLADGKCLFLSSGSEAVEFGVQITRRITGQPLLLALCDAYLAAYGSAGRLGSQEWMCFDWTVCADCSRVDDCDPGCEHLRRIPFQNIGGLVFEPGSSSGLVRFPPTSLVRTLANLVRQNGGLIVVDEVTTGLGRTGTWYGFQHYGLSPDVVALGKGLGNGYPVSAVAMTADVATRLDDGEFHYAQSHQNDPLGCAIAREVIRVLREEGLVERSARVGAHFLHELERLAAWHTVVTNTRGRGLMIAVAFDEAEGFSLAKAHRRLAESGYIAGYKPAAHLLRFYPPLTIGEEDVAGFVENLEQALR
jgi:acetylornithine/N-succinyldiaminopimelate aminotransferase